MFIADQYNVFHNASYGMYSVAYDGSCWFYGGGRDGMLAHWNL